WRFLMNEQKRSGVSRPRSLATRTKSISSFELKSACAAANSGGSAMHGVQVVEKKSTTRILPGSGAGGTVPLLTGCNEKLGAAEPALRLNEHANCFGANQTQYQADPTKSTTIKAIATSTCLRQTLRKNRPIVPVSAQSRRFGHNAGIFCRT